MIMNVVLLVTETGAQKLKPYLMILTCQAYLLIKMNVVWKQLKKNCSIYMKENGQKNVKLCQN